MSVLDALKGVLKTALIHDGLARGLREASKALDRRQAHMCVLNESCEEEAYKKLVVALCSEHKIPLIKVPDGKQLGEWAGLCEFRILLRFREILPRAWANQTLASRPDRS
jgi:small subunit ribosomal protein S12e